ncbi:hypothetical protein AAE478_009518 [Parahypoxylon ruwenzoriense]
MDLRLSATRAEPSGAPQHQQQAGKPLSCTNCRARKLKCSREHPCHHCVRSGAECVFPARKRIRQPRRSKNTELLQRLSRLETIVGKVGGLTDLGGGGGSGGGSAALNLLDPNLVDPGGPMVGGGGSGSEAQRDWGQIMRDSKAARYLSGQFWTSLCLEVEGLRQALEQSTDSDEDDDEQQQQPLQEATPESAANDNSSSAASAAFSPGMLLGVSSRLTAHEQIEHPPADHIRFLTATFFRNVDMILKILHRPTIEAALLALADAPSPGFARAQLSPDREALFFAVYHAAAASLPAAACVARLGRPREDLLRSYAAGVEHLLVRAHYLNSSSLEALQALTLYVACLRSHNSHSPRRSGSRACWALLSLPVRLAQALRLHREASNAHLRPYEAELRRRLWWQLIVLDIRASEDRGTTTVVARNSYDTRLPLNVNDADFGPATPADAPLVERQGPTDVTFSLCTAQSSGIFLYVEHAQGAGGSSSSSSAGAQAGAPKPPQQNVDETIRHAQHLESQFVTGADQQHPGSYLASVTVRLIILKLWLIVQYPLHPYRRRRPPAAQPQQAQAQNAVFPHEATLRTAVSIMELDGYIQNGPYGDRFRWWADTYVQWHPLAVALTELYSQHARAQAQPQQTRDLVDRAWSVVEDVFPRWSEVIADTKRGTLWRPIRKLYKKAKAARSAAAAAKSTGAGTGAGEGEGTDTTTVVTAATRDQESSPRISTNPGTDRIENRPSIIVDAGATITAEPENTYGMDINDTSIELSIPPDLDKLSMSPYAFNESMLGWRDLSFDIPFLDPAASSNMVMDWSTWDDFVNETQEDGQSKSGSSVGSG